MAICPLSTGCQAEEAEGEGQGEADALAVPAPSIPPEDQTALVVDSINKRGAFSEVSFRLHRGEILGVFALMGGGQMQLGRCLFGAERLDGGSITLGGRPVTLRNTTQAKAAGIAFVPEDRRNSLMMRQEIFKNITLAHLPRLVGRWLDEKAETTIARQQIAALVVRPGDPRLTTGALSGGNQQKVVLGKWLTRMPRILILNEPTRGMDVGAKEEVLAIVKRLRDEGVAILLITAQPETLVGVATRALVMRKGRVTATVAGEHLTKQALLRHA